MMRLVISSRHHHFGKQQGFYNAITTRTSTSKVEINWTFSHTRCYWRFSDKRNNEQTFSPKHFWVGPEKSSTIPTLLFSSSIKSCSPLLPPPHILPSRLMLARVQWAEERKAKALLSSSAPHSLARESGYGSRCCEVAAQRRFLHQMSIPHRRLHSSSPKSLLSTTTNSPTSTFSFLRSGSRSHHHSLEENSEFFHISPEVRKAVEGNVPIVALESAIITHGMPFPDNVDTAFRLERIIREHGVVPATVGVVNGCLTVGLSMKEIESLGEWAKHRASGNTECDSYPPTVKVSRRDFPFALSNKLNGGTTVSGTIIGAVKAGISIFATGGLGGVHRGAETSFDISADLKELGRNPIAVISAGVKSILDIGKTLEYMETEGICVAVLQDGKKSENDGKPDQKKTSATIASAGGGLRLQQQIGTVKFPSFFTAQSQFPAPYSVQNESEAASLIHSAFQFQLDSGVLIAVPIPKEHEGAGKMIEDAIKRALEEAEKRSVKGKDMTPFLLGEVSRLTGGESLRANKHLIENNVKTASEIATRLAQLRHVHTSSSSSSSTEERTLYNVFGSTGASSSLEAGGQRSTLGNTVQHGIQGKSCDSSRLTGKSDGESSSGGGCREWKELKNRSYGIGSSTTDSTPNNASPTTESQSTSSSPLCQKHERPVVIGGTSLDLVLAVEENEIVRDGRTHTSNIKTAPGGVARNMAEAIRKLGHEPIFLSAIGKDLFGRELMRQFELMRMDWSKIKMSKQSSTAIYSALLNNKGECLFGLGDMRIHDEIGSDYIHQHRDIIESAPVVVLDANVPTTTIANVLEICTLSRTPVWFEPTEIRKARKICSVPWEHLPALSYISPNIHELKSIVDEASKSFTHPGTTPNQNVYFDQIPNHLKGSPLELNLITECFKVLPALQVILLTRGSDGIMVTYKLETGQLESFCHRAPELSPEAIISVSGAGDCLNAGFISGLLQGLSWKSCAQLGTSCAAQSLQSIKNVPDAFTFSVN